MSDWQPGDPIYEYGYAGPSVTRRMFEIVDDTDTPSVTSAARWIPEKGWGPGWL